MNREFALFSPAFYLAQKYWDAESQRPYRFASVLMIESAFKKTERWQAMESELAQPFDRSTADPQALATTK